MCVVAADSTGATEVSKLKISHSHCLTYETTNFRCGRLDLDADLRLFWGTYKPLVACQNKCDTTPTCIAIDYNVESAWCAGFTEACTIPTHVWRGSSSYKKISLQAKPCDASNAPTNGVVGDCTNTLASGSSCQPTCGNGYTPNGTSFCTTGTLTAATCEATQLLLLILRSRHACGTFLNQREGKTNRLSKLVKFWIICQTSELSRLPLEAILVIRQYSKLSKLPRVHSRNSPQITRISQIRIIWRASELFSLALEVIRIIRHPQIIWIS